MREQLKSHEQDIIDRVVLQLRTPNQPPSLLQAQNIQPLREPQLTSTHLTPSLSMNRIQELENQLAQLRAETELLHEGNQAQQVAGMYNPTQTTLLQTGESASATATVNLVEALFPGVERNTLVQIIENRFKPTNIYRLRSTEKKHAESQRTINIGGVEFEQAERDRKQSEYRMRNSFKAWAAYSGILIKLASYSLQAELATALFISRMNLYELWEKYTWEGVKGYHFQFHRKRVASGKNIFTPEHWRQLDGELVASKCFGYPILRSTWNTILGRPSTYSRNI